MKDLTARFGFFGALSPSVTLALAARAKEMKKQGKDVVSMSVGEPDFDTPRAIKDACIKALNEGKVGYVASSGLPELKEKIVQKFKANGIETSAKNIVVSTGAKFALFEAITALCTQGDEVVVFAPYWLSYVEMIKASGATVKVVETFLKDGFEPKREALESAISENTKLIIVNSPNNPTGAVYSKKTLEMIADVAVSNNIMVLSDEIYEKLIYDSSKPHISIASLNEKIADLTITVNGFSKAYAMTGWRLGYVNAPEWLLKRISSLQSHATSNATTFVQYAGIAALEGEADDDVLKMIKTFADRRKLICRLLSEITQIDFCVPSGAFYVLCDVSKTALSADEFAARLLEEKLVVVTPCTSFGTPRCIRLSYACDEKAIKTALLRIKQFCEGLNNNEHR